MADMHNFLVNDANLCKHLSKDKEKRGKEMMKKNLKKAVSLALASVMALSLTACKGGSGSGTTTAAVAAMSGLTGTVLVYLILINWQ